MKNNQVLIKAKTDDTITVAGYGVVFGGADLYGETFAPSTDFMLDLVPEKPVLYDHGLNEGVQKSILGKIEPDRVTVDDDGLWIEAELSRHNDYVAYVERLIEDGALGWSSGTVAQLALIDGKMIKRWPVIEWSLTPTPAEPRTLGVQQLKSLANLIPVLDVLSTASHADDIPKPDTVNGKTVEPKDARSASAIVPETAEDRNASPYHFVRVHLETLILKWRLRS